MAGGETVLSLKRKMSELIEQGMAARAKRCRKDADELAEQLNRAFRTRDAYKETRDVLRDSGFGIRFDAECYYNGSRLVYFVIRTYDNACLTVLYKFVHDPSPSNRRCLMAFQSGTPFASHEKIGWTGCMTDLMSHPTESFNKIAKSMRLPALLTQGHLIQLGLAVLLNVIDVSTDDFLANFQLPVIKYYSKSPSNWVFVNRFFHQTPENGAQVIFELYHAGGWLSFDAYPPDEPVELLPAPVQAPNQPPAAQEEPADAPAQPEPAADAPKESSSSSSDADSSFYDPFDG